MNRNRELTQFLKVIHLADGEGWMMFDPEIKERGRRDTLSVFEQMGRLVVTGAD